MYDREKLLEIIGKALVQSEKCPAFHGFNPDCPEGKICLRTDCLECWKKVLDKILIPTEGVNTELLEAAKRMSDFLDILEPPLDVIRLHSAVDNLRQVIAKAEGRTPDEAKLPTDKME